VKLLTNPLNQEMLDQIMREIGLEHMDDSEQAADHSSFMPANTISQLLTTSFSK
jgi:hypothetical protein